MRTIAGKLWAFVRRHCEALWVVVSVVFPIILRTRARPVIFSKWSGIGDIICTFPAALELKKRHPGSVFIYNCHPEYTCLPRLAGVTDLTASFQNIGLVGHRYKFLFTAFYDFPCADERENDFCKDYVVKEYASDHSVVVDDAHPQMEIPPVALERANNILKSHLSLNSRLVVIQTGPSWPIREWPMAAWVGLIAELKKSPEITVVQIGTDHQLAVGRREVPTLPSVVSLVNKLSLEDSCAIISKSQLFIGIDSGMLHIAAALQVPCVGIFGPTSPNLRLPARDVKNCVISRIQCQGCHHRVPRIHWEKGCPYDAACMKNISVNEVFEKCARLLSLATSPIR